MPWKKILLVVGIIVVVFVALGQVRYPHDAFSHVMVGGKTFSVEVVDTALTLEKGLSGHPPLADDAGMLFIFPTPHNYGFWMKDMLFPLDIIWIDSHFQIIHIEKSLATSTYPKVFYPNGEALYVLEVNAGQLDKLEAKIGDTVNFIKKEP